MAELSIFKQMFNKYPPVNRGFYRKGNRFLSVTAPLGTNHAQKRETVSNDILTFSPLKRGYPKELPQKKQGVFISLFFTYLLATVGKNANTILQRLF